MKKIIIAVALILAVGTLYAAPSVTEILAKVDEVLRVNSDLSAKVTLTQQKASQGTKQYSIVYYRNDNTDSYLILFTAPETDKGNGYLRVGNNFWMYRRNTRTFQFINRDEKIAGTGAKSGDFEKRKLSELYRPVTNKQGVAVITEEMMGKIPVYKFELIAKVYDVTYPRQTYWVRKDNYLPLKVQSFSLSDTLMETAYYLNYTEIGGKYIMSQVMFIDEFEKGNKTILEISGISLEKVDSAVFTKAYLENLSK